MRRTAEMTVFTERHEFRNYNVGLLLTRLRPLGKTERAEQIQMLKWGPFGPLIIALQRAA